VREVNLGIKNKERTVKDYLLRGYTSLGEGGSTV